MREGATGDRRICAEREAPHERQSARECRAQEKASLARISRLCSQARPPRKYRSRERPATGTFSARCHEVEYGELSSVRARREHVHKLDAIYEVSKKFWMPESFPEGL